MGRVCIGACRATGRASGFVLGLLHIVVAVVVSAGSTVIAAPDTTDSDVILTGSLRLFIGHLNVDSYPDTVYGVADRGARALPVSIAWGIGPATKQGSSKNHRTEIRYPKWATLGGSVAIQRLNSDDTLSDLCIYLWGTYKQGAKTRDTMRVLAIFGQSNLDRVPEIRLKNIDGFQTEPFIAMDLRADSEFVKPAVRDMSGKRSYELKQIRLGEKIDTSRTKPPVAPPAPSYTVRVYPNPTAQTAHVEASVLPSGEYHVTVMSVNGRVVHEQSVSVSLSGELFRLLDLGSLSSGYYIVRLYSDQKMIGSYPIVIAR